MNSEELEQSLRMEFENYLKAIVAEIRQETAEFQSKVESEFERHKGQLDEALKAFCGRFEQERDLDPAFSGSVAEHLRLARDEGAKIAATAMAEAEKLDSSTHAEAAPAPVYDKLRDAINDISSKDSQSSILKSLVQHAGEFASRGAFFIIKNEHFAGWKVFGTDDAAAEAAVREIHFPTSSASILGDAVRSLSTTEGSAGSSADDDAFLEKLGYGHPDKMYAVPLMARGRGVAVLYADHGEGGEAPNIEALEMLVRVAGLTVELHASAQPARAGEAPPVVADLEAPHYEAEHSFDRPHVAEPVVESPAETPSFAFSESVSFEGGFPQESAPSFEPAPEYKPEIGFETPFADSPFTAVEVQEAAPEPVEAETFEYQNFETVQTTIEPEPFAEPVQTFEPVYEQEPAVQFEAREPEPAAFGSSPFERTAEEFAPAGMPSGGFEPAVEHVVETVSPAPAVPKARLSDRPVDLPIDVPEEERRSHNDARRFARLLVSEIKLYNEKKVIEGRESSDLYSRLQEAIDRSREMYDKRVQPPVASKFDYFHYELVNSLAEGDAGRLGAGYPGASV